MNNCPNCGSEINSGENFCRKCGTKISVTQNNIEDNTQQVNNQEIITTNQTAVQPQNNMNDNDDLINSYIGKNADKLKKGGFSPNTFFFGVIYVFYRKMWLLGLIWLAIISVLSLLLPPLYADIILIIFGIAISVKFKKFYLKHVEKKVNKIKLANPEQPKEQLIKICSKKGGTTIIPVIIAIVLCAFLLFMVLSNVIKTYMDANKEYEKIKNIQKNEDNLTKVIFNNLSINIPIEFRLSNNSTDNFKEYTKSLYNPELSNLSYLNYCSIVLSLTEGMEYNNDSKQYLENTTSHDDNGIREKRINNKIWYYGSTTDNYDQIYNYATENNGKIYQVKFYSYGDTENECTTTYEKVINSAQFK